MAIHDTITGQGSGTNGNRQTTAYMYDQIGKGEQSDKVNWGQHASRSLYNVFANASDNKMKDRSFLDSRLWHGVPQLTVDQMNMFEAAYTGHTFIFVVEVPKFMCTGIYENTNMHYHLKNLKSIIERASTSFNGASDISAEFGNQEDGNGKKLSHVTSITKQQNSISLTLHEFSGLPVKNALEAWMTGTYDYKSMHGNYFGNLGIPGGWCLSNHTMSILVVQVDPSWTIIQDAAYYYNMFPENVPFEHFNWRKGEYGIVQDVDITFTCNEERSPAIMYAAERYMNNRILSMVATSVYNSRQFVAHNFMDGSVPMEYSGFQRGLTSDTENGYQAGFVDKQQYNIKITNNTDDGYGSKVSDTSMVEEYESNIRRAEVNVDKQIDPAMHAVDYTDADESYNPYASVPSNGR